MRWISGGFAALVTSRPTSLGWHAPCIDSGRLRHHQGGAGCPQPEDTILTPTTSQTYIVAADVLRGELSAAQQRLDHDALTALARGRAMLRQDTLDGAAHADPAVRAALAAEITIE